MKGLQEFWRRVDAWLITITLVALPGLLVAATQDRVWAVLYILPFVYFLRRLGNSTEEE